METWYRELATQASDRKRQAKSAGSPKTNSRLQIDTNSATTRTPGIASPSALRETRRILEEQQQSMEKEREIVAQEMKKLRRERDDALQRAKTTEQELRKADREKIHYFEDLERRHKETVTSLRNTIHQLEHQKREV